MRNNPFYEKVNFIIGVVFIGAAALLATIVMLKAAELEEPLSTYMATIASYEDL